MTSEVSMGDPQFGLTPSSADDASATSQPRKSAPRKTPRKTSAPAENADSTTSSDAPRARSSRSRKSAATTPSADAPDATSAETPKKSRARRSAASATGADTTPDNETNPAENRRAKSTGRRGAGRSAASEQTPGEKVDEASATTAASAAKAATSAKTAGRRPRKTPPAPETALEKQVTADAAPARTGTKAESPTAAAKAPSSRRRGRPKSEASDTASSDAPRMVTNEAPTEQRETAPYTADRAPTEEHEAAPRYADRAPAEQAPTNFTTDFKLVESAPTDLQAPERPRTDPAAAARAAKPWRPDAEIPTVTASLPHEPMQRPALFAPAAPPAVHEAAAPPAVHHQAQSPALHTPASPPAMNDPAVHAFSATSSVARAPFSYDASGAYTGSFPSDAADSSSFTHDAPDASADLDDTSSDDAAFPAEATSEAASPSKRRRSRRGGRGRRRGGADPQLADAGMETSAPTAASSADPSAETSAATSATDAFTADPRRTPTASGSTAIPLGAAPGDMDDDTDDMDAADDLAAESANAEPGTSRSRRNRSRNRRRRKNAQNAAQESALSASDADVDSPPLAVRDAPLAARDTARDIRDSARDIRESAKARNARNVPPVELEMPDDIDEENDEDMMDLVDEDEARARDSKTPRASRKMLISVQVGDQVEVVLTEGTAVQEYYVEMVHQAKIRGNIYKGVISNIDTNLQAAFVNFGKTKNGFLQIDEIHPEYWLSHHEPVKGQKYPPIQKVLKAGQEVLVQVVKEPTGNKGAFLTTWVSLAGRFLVLTPGQEQIGISRKVEDGEERNRLRELIAGLDPGPGLGAIVRTVSAGTSKTTLLKDLNYLKRVWKDIRKKATTETAPSLIYQEPGLASRAVRDYLSDDVDEIWVDDPETAEIIRETTNLVFPRKRDLVRLYTDVGQTLWEKHQVRKQLEQVHSREVTLPSGGRLVFDQTEALMAIDINSGKSTGKTSFEAMAHRTNIEAAEAIAHQLRLRDIGGQIVIDFIEMRDPKHCAEVEKVMRAAMKGDRARHDVGHMSSFGLMQIVRQRTGSSAISITLEPCPHCKGTGVRRNMEWQALQAQREIRRQLRLAAANGVGEYTHTLESEAGLYLLNNKRERLTALEKEFGVRLSIKLMDLCE